MKKTSIFNAFEGGHLDGALFGRPRPEAKAHPKGVAAEPGPVVEPPDTRDDDTRPDAER